MHRYLKVIGVTGSLVADPHSNARRYVGMRQKARPADAGPFVGDLVDAFEPREQVIRDHPSLRAAAKAGEIKILDEAVGRDEATAFAFPPQNKPQKEVPK